MLSLDFLNHSLIKKEYNNFHCTKCNNLFWYQDKYSEDYDDECVDSQFFIYHKHRRYMNGECKLTCEELIIKNIIE